MSTGNKIGERHACVWQTEQAGDHTPDDTAAGGTGSEMHQTGKMKRDAGAEVYDCKLP